MALPVSFPVKRIADLTVAVATLDRPEILACCVESILKGEVLPGELIVVDQSGSQSGQPVIERLQNTTCPILYIPQQKQGLSASRNIAIERSSRQIIAFTDDDCVPDAGWIASLENALSTPPLPAAVSGRVLPYGPDFPDLYSVSPRESEFRADFIGKKIPWLVGTGGNLSIRREWIDRVGMFDERLGAGAPGRAAEDGDMIYRLLKSGARMRYEPKALIFHKRQNIARRMSSRWNYGFGIGAFCALWMRKMDVYVIYIMISWLISLLREGIGLALKGQSIEVLQRWHSFSGTMHGFVFGLLAAELK